MFESFEDFASALSKFVIVAIIIGALGVVGFIVSILIP